jgi:hypothetical protein
MSKSRENQAQEPARYTSAGEIRAAFYPRMARLPGLDPGALISCLPFPAAGRPGDEDQETGL